MIELRAARLSTTLHRLFTPVIAPLLDAVEPKVIIETGSGSGRLTRRLLGHASEQAHLCAIDPDPSFDPAALTKSGRASLTLRRARSLDILGTLEPCDLAVLDGDPNWYTVRHELGLLADVARREHFEPPVVVVHHTDWPFGRRDGYFDIDSIPEAMRLRHEAAGLLPWSAEPQAEGLRMVPDVASAERQPRNGVMTAVEDFLIGDAGSWTMVELQGLHGIVVLVPSERLAARPAIAPLLARFTDPRFLNGQVHRVEREWIRELVDVRRERGAEASPQPAKEAFLPAGPPKGAAPGQLELEAEYGRGLSAGEHALAQARLQARAEHGEWLVQVEREKAGLAQQAVQARAAAAQATAEHAEETRERSQEERDAFHRSSVEAELRLEMGARDLEGSRREVEALRERIGGLERECTELTERLRGAEAKTLKSTNEARTVSGRASHYAELLDGVRAEMQRLEVRTQDVEIAYATVERERRLAADLLDRATERAGWRFGRRLSRIARRVTFRGPGSPHPLDDARARLRQELTQKTENVAPT